MAVQTLDASGLTIGDLTANASATATTTSNDVILYNNGGVLKCFTHGGSAETLAAKIGAVSTSAANTFTEDQIIGGTTPRLTIGDAGAEDASLVFDGNAQDYYIGLDDAGDYADDLLIGLGNAVGTTPAISIDENLKSTFYGDVTIGGTTPVLTIGDAGAEDTALIFDGNAQDFYIALDDTADDLVIGLGSTIGSTPALSVDENQFVTLHKTLQFTDAGESIKRSANGFLDLLAGTKINLSGAVATTSTITAEGVVSGAAGQFDALAGTSLALQTGGITAAGAIGGATTISGSGLISSQAGIVLFGVTALAAGTGITLPADKAVKAMSYITYSDATLKKDIKTIENPLEKVMSMRGVSYQFKHDKNNNREVGFLAQEMKNTVPEVVHGSGDGNLGIDYSKLTSVLVEAVKAQQVQIDDLKAMFKRDN